MKLCVIGTGCVGLTAAACLAELGHEVLGVDQDAKKIEMISSGQIPFYELGLAVLVARNVQGGRLSFSSSRSVAVDSCLVIFITVGTPALENGDPDLSYVESVAQTIAAHMSEYRIIVEKSTTPIYTGEWITRVVQLNKKTHVSFDVVSNPEFLREGNAVSDFLFPERIVVGVQSERAAEIMRKIYAPILEGRVRIEQLSSSGISPPGRSGLPRLLLTDVKSAEMIKHASNSFLAMKISFANALS